MKTLADYLNEKGLDPAKTIVSYKGEIYPPGTDLKAIAYTPGEVVETFRIVAGG